jgi:hypothetical protein
LDFVTHHAKKIWKWASTPRRATKLDVVVVSLALAAAYYLAVARPVQQRNAAAEQAHAVEKLKAETSTRQVELDKCLTAAQVESDARWKAICKAKGQGAGCLLTRRETDAHTQDAGRVRNACLIKHAIAN